MDISMNIYSKRNVNHRHLLTLLRWSGCRLNRFTSQSNKDTFPLAAAPCRTLLPSYNDEVRTHTMHLHMKGSTEQYISPYTVEHLTLHYINVGIVHNMLYCGRAVSIKGCLYCGHCLLIIENVSGITAGSPMLGTPIILVQRPINPDLIKDLWIMPLSPKTSEMAKEQERKVEPPGIEPRATGIPCHCSATKLQLPPATTTLSAIPTTYIEQCTK